MGGKDIDLIADVINVTNAFIIYWMLKLYNETRLTHEDIIFHILLNYYCGI